MRSCRSSVKHSTYERRSSCAKVVRGPRNLLSVTARATAVHAPTTVAAVQLKRMAHLLRTLLHREDDQDWDAQLAAAIKTCPSKLLLLVQGASEANTEVLQLLTEVFDITARVAPTCDVVPLLPCAGWTEELVVEMLSVSALLTPPSPPPQDLDLYYRLRSRHAPDNPPQLIHLDCTNINLHSPHSTPRSTPTPSTPPENISASSASDPQLPANHSRTALTQTEASGSPGSRAEPGTSLGRFTAVGQQRAEHSAASSDDVAAESGCPLRASRLYEFKRVALGGTFDRLHAGHRLLLSAAAVICTEDLYIGVTADALLAKKANRSLLQSYSQRVAEVERYVKAVNPSVNIDTGALSDPKEPTAAELVEAMEAIVVSEETIPGAEAINKGRVARGFAPLEIIVVGLVGVDPQGQKLSSSALRSLEALVHQAD